MQMPEVDRQQASKAAVAARRARAELKEQIRAGAVTPLRVLQLASEGLQAAASLRVPEFLTTLPAIGAVKAARIMEELSISPRKRLGGLGSAQRARLQDFLADRAGISQMPPLTVLAGPTAVGKGTVVAYIKEHYPNVKLSVSATTRAPRPGEVHGEHYYFVTDQEFDRMLAHNELLEWATVHGVHRYGTPRAPLAQAAAQGSLGLREIDLQGARQVRKAEPAANLVFLAPPSWEELVRRLTGRGTESKEEQDRRLATAKVELAAAKEFDAIVVNDEVARAAEEVVALMRGGSNIAA